MRFAAGSLRADAAGLRDEAGPSPTFHGRLHLALVGERDARERRPAARLERALTLLVSQRPSAAAVSRGLAMAAALAVVFALGLAIVTAPPVASSDVAVRHVTSMTVEPADDGRVYAALTQRSALGKAGLREVHLR